MWATAWHLEASDKRQSRGNPSSVSWLAHLQLMSSPTCRYPEPIFSMLKCFRMMQQENGESEWMRYFQRSVQSFVVGQMSRWFKLKQGQDSLLVSRASIKRVALTLAECFSTHKTRAVTLDTVHSTTMPPAFVEWGETRLATSSASRIESNSFELKKFKICV